MKKNSGHRGRFQNNFLIDGFDLRLKNSLSQRQRAKSPGSLINTRFL